MESLVVLLDSKLQFLPIEKLNVFKDVGAKSRDISLFGNLSFLNYKIPKIQKQNKTKTKLSLYSLTATTFHLL